MATILINPNLHVALIHYPLALLIIGTLIELFSFFWRRSSFRVAGRWMILLGALSAIPTTFSGMYALSDIAHRNNPMPAAPWVDVKTTSPLLSQPDAWKTLHDHALYQSISTGICVLVVIGWLACSDHARRSLHLPFMVLLLLGMSIIIRGTWHGGEAVYVHGAGVGLSDSSTAEKDAADPPSFAFEKYIQPVEMHVIAAGMAIALAMVSIGLSVRRITSTVAVNDTRPIVPREETMARKSPRTPPTPMAMVRSFNPDIEVTLHPFAPAGRFWLLTFVVALMTLAGGWFVIADADLFAATQQKHHPLARAAWHALMDEIQPAQVRNGKVNRAFAHTTTGTVIVLTPLILGALARFAPRRRFWLAFFTMILVVAVSAQIWFGVLLLFDTPEGPIAHFQTSAMATTQPG